MLIYFNNINNIVFLNFFNKIKSILISPYFFIVILISIFCYVIFKILKERKIIFKDTLEFISFMLIFISVMISFQNAEKYIIKNNNSKDFIYTKKDKYKNKKILNVNQNYEYDYNVNIQNDKAPDFTLYDQYGNKHSLSDYKGKIVFINFWATWCSPCKDEMPFIEQLYNEYGKNEKDVIFISISNPNTETSLLQNDITEDEIKTFLKENNYYFPVLFDTNGSVLQDYFISSFPTTFIIDRESNIYTYFRGAIEKKIMKNVIDEAIKNK